MHSRSDEVIKSFLFLCYLLLLNLPPAVLPVLVSYIYIFLKLLSIKLLLLLLVPLHAVSNL